MELDLKAPLNGVFVPIDLCSDPVFASRTLGDGISVDPLDNILVAPCEGEIVQLHRCSHALTIKTKNNLEVLLHIGINTVGLEGKGFKPLVQVGDTVKIGQKLIEFDADFVASQSTSLMTQMIVLNSDAFTKGSLSSSCKNGQTVDSGKDTVASFTFTAKEVVATESQVAAPTKTMKTYPKVSSKSLEITNHQGLHARPIAVLTASAKTFSSDLTVQLGSKTANAKSVTSLLELDVRFNDVIKLIAQGPDAEAAIRTLSQLIQSGLGEKTPIAPARSMYIQKPKEEAPVENTGLRGVSASPGVALGNVFQIRHSDIPVTEAGQSFAAEKSLLQKALSKAQEDLMQLELNLKKSNDATKAAIFSAHIEILADPDINAEVEALIANGKSAGFAWKFVVGQKADKLSRSKNELLAGRANDLRDVTQRVLRIITGKTGNPLPVLPENTILIAEDLTPSDTANLDATKVRGFCTVAGSATSHVAILARSLGIPALAAIDNKALNIPNGAQVILNADMGLLQENPNADEIMQLEHNQQIKDLQKKQFMNKAHDTASTLDGQRIEVVANVGSLTDVQKAVELGAEGVGLLRSEFLFLDRQTAPTEDEQYEVYKKMALALGKERPLIIRTLDVGGDKPLPYLPIPREDNPFLGERGIRVGINNPEVLVTQVRAILRASEHGQLMIMFPMISGIAEFETVRDVVKEQARLLRVPLVPLGIMVEVPSAALLAEQLAPLVDFFSIGTNDLTQYTLAMDRGNPALAGKLDGLDPAVLRLIDMTVKAGQKHNKWTGVCGGLASESIAVPILVGLGVKELSVSGPSLPFIKAQIRGLNKKHCHELAQMALAETSASQVRQIVKNVFPQGAF